MRASSWPLRSVSSRKSKRRRNRRNETCARRGATPISDEVALPAVFIASCSLSIMHSKKVVVTGAGAEGLSEVRYLLQRGYTDIVVTDAVSRILPPGVQGSFGVRALDALTETPVSSSAVLACGVSSPRFLTRNAPPHARPAFVFVVGQCTRDVEIRKDLMMSAAFRHSELGGLRALPHELTGDERLQRGQSEGPARRCHRSLHARAGHRAPRRMTRAEGCRRA